MRTKCLSTVEWIDLKCYINGEDVEKKEPPTLLLKM